MRPWAARGLVVLLVGVVLATAGAPAIAVADTDNGEAVAEDYDSVTFDITVHENGSATWAFTYERALPTEEDRANFEAFAASFEEDGGTLYDRRVAQAENLTASGEETTGREMAASNFERSATVEEGVNDLGIVTVSFLWEGFAEREGSDVIAHDVINRLWLEPDQELVIRAGDGLSFAEVYPEGSYSAESLEEATAVSWSGEDHDQFSEGQPYVRFTADGDGIATTTLVAGALVVAVVAGVALAWYRTREPATSPPREDVPQPSETVTPAEEELLSDEDRVVKLIEDNGGRMKQVKIVEETGWSKSKVSMLLSEMDEEGTISKLRVGRENIISLQGFEPEAAKSPHES